MATVYSLICWGGSAGKSVTVSSTTDYVTLANHGLRNGTGVAFTSGTLPTVSGTALALNTTYYAKSISSSTFELYRESSLTTKIDFTSNGSTLVMKSAYYLGLSDTSRWGSRIYNGLLAWRNARVSAASAYDTEVCEIGEVFDDYITAVLTLNVPAAETIIAPEVSGVKTSAWHNGVYGAGYTLKCNGEIYNSIISMSGLRHTLRDISITTAANNVDLIGVAGVFNTVSGIIAYNTTGNSSIAGIVVNGSGAKVISCISVNMKGNGFRFQDYSGDAGIFCNNLAVKCTTGFSGGTNQLRGFYYNNVAAGNTTNWSAVSNQLTGAGYNVGEAGNAVWYSGTDTSIKTITTSHFVNYAGNDFRPTSTSPVKDAGVVAVGVPAYDIKYGLKPSYNNGGAEAWDSGPYEYDNGFGFPPNTVTVAGSGIASGTRIKIAKQSDGTEYRNVVSGTSDSYTQNVGESIPVYIYARKGSAAPFYKPLKLSSTITTSGLTYSLSGLQVEDIARGASYPAGVATDWTVAPFAHVSGTTRYSVQDLYSYHQDYYDDSATVDDNPLMDGTTPNIFELINGGTISDADLQYLYGGSVEFANGDLWSNLYTVGGISGTPNIYIYQGTTKLTQFWAAGHVDILVNVKNTGTLISSGLVTGYARKWGYTYDNYETDLSSGGRNVMPLASLPDAAITDTEATVSGWTDVTVTFGTYSLDFGDVAGAKPYYVRVNCNNRPLAEVYQRLQYLTREGSTTSLNGVTGDRYQSANAAFTPIKTAPFGTYSGGVFAAAKGVWLDNVKGTESTNYIVTDNDGGTHQNVSTDMAHAQITGIVAGSRLQVYNETTATELVNAINAGTSWSADYVDGTGYTTGDIVRVRLTYCTGLTAKLPAEYKTVAASSGWAVLAAQVDDEVYISNGIDGSTVTEYGSDYANVQIDISDGDGTTTIQRGYAWYCDQMTGDDGIRYFYGAFKAEDALNYLLDTDVANIKLQNTGTSGVTVTGGAIRRKDGSSPIAAGGSIYLYYGRTYAVETGVSGLTPTESDKLLSIEIPAVVNANIVKVNGVSVDGTGTPADPWGPV